MKNKKIDTSILTLIAFAISLNIVGALIALLLRFPIYMDSIGTIMIAALLGPRYAVITGVCGSLISGMTFDTYSLFYAPVQIFTGYLSGLMFEKGWLKGKRTFLGVFIFVLPTSILSAVITAFVFGGITSSGSSYIVQGLSALGVNKVVSAFITQIVTDYSDKFVGVIMSTYIIKAIPKNIVQNIKLKVSVNNG